MIAIALLVVVLAAAIVLSFLASAPQELWYPVAGHLPSTSFRQEPSPRVQHLPEHPKMHGNESDELVSHEHGVAA